MEFIKNFFKDDMGVSSMTRLLTFINGGVSAVVTISIAFNPTPITTNDLALIFELWLLTYAGKNAGKYLEKLPTNSPKQ